MPWKTECKKEQRWRFIKEYHRSENGLAEHCRRWRISRKTAYKWLARFEERGRFGLGDRPRAAQRVHNRPGAIWLQRLRRRRARHPTWGAPKLCWAIRRQFGAAGAPSEAAIGRWLKAWKLTRRPRRPPHKGTLLQRPRLTEPQNPNEVWTVDFKGWFRTGDGTRVDPLTVRDLASRYVLAVVLLRGQGVAPTRQAMTGVFKQYGLPLVIRVDNGAPFGSTGALGLTRLSAWWIKLGIQVEFIAPRHPEQNGAHEQMHRVYKEDTTQPAAASLREQQAQSQRWRKHYNQRRPHEGILMRPPAELYHKSRRRLPKDRPWRYARGWRSRLVKGKGMIHFNGRSRYVGEAFERERVGLKQVRPGVWEAYFGPLRIGELWDHDGTPGIRAGWYVRRRRR